MKNNIESLERFSNSLRFAIYDKQLELNNIPIHFYYDNDVIFKTVMGFEHIYPERETNKKALLVRGLLSCGYLGKFYILRPHAYEFYEKIRHKQQYKTKEDLRHFFRRVRKHSEQLGLQDYLERLSDIMQSIPRDKVEGEKIREDFINALRLKSGETFAQIVQFNGTWDQRLRRLYDQQLFDIENLGAEITEIILERRKLLDDVYNIIRTKRPEKYINAFQDAYAITILDKFIRDRDIEQDPSSVLCRFYTETEKLAEAIQEPFIQDILTYKNPVVNNFSWTGGNTIYRNADYFIVRVMFNALSPRKKKLNRVEMEKLEAELSNLKEISLTLINLQNSSKEDKDYEAAIQKEYDGIKLSDLLRQFEDLEIMDSLWHEGNIPPGMEKLDELRKWTEIFQYAQERRTGVIINKQIIDITSKIEEQIKRIHNWTEDYKAVMTACKKKRGKYSERLVEPLRDLGLIRWTHKIKDQEVDEIKQELEQLTSDDQGKMENAAQTLATNMEISRTNPTRCLLTCAILWSLGCFNIINKLIDELREGTEKNIPPSLEIMKLAAKIKSGEQLTKKGRKFIVDDATILLNKVKDKRSIYLGVGYVLYQAWKQEMIGRSTLERTYECQPENIRRWAENSFRIGKLAVSEFTENSLSWAYAINHCTYVGAMTDIYQEATNHYLDILLRLKSFPDLWSPRFDDTLGCYYLVRAEKKFVQKDGGKKYNFESDIKFASLYLEDALENDPGDIDILEHLGRLHILRNSLENPSS